MEHLLQLEAVEGSGFRFGSFNPYFYGTSTSTWRNKVEEILKISFNPYFYGTSTSTIEFPDTLRIEK